MLARLSPLEKRLVLVVVVLAGAIVVVSLWPEPEEKFSFPDCADTAATGVPQVECETLVALFHETGGMTTWQRHDHWGKTDVVCDWYGVTCADGRVTGLTLGNNGLVGALPVELVNLTQLRRLFLA